MVTKYSFRCTKCEKLFEINGKFYNQWLMHWYLEYKYMLHEIIFHKNSPHLIYFVKMNLLAIPLCFLQVLDIILEPLRRIL